MPDPGEVTVLLKELRAGRQQAFDVLLPLVYEELRAIARRHLRGSRPGASLDTLGLVHEAWIKLAAAERLTAEDRAHFLALCARAMRQVVIDAARSRAAAKRGAAARPQTLSENQPALASDLASLLDLDRALDRLAATDERLVRLVECRHFTGLSEEETAEALGLSLRTVQRDWLRARAWLREALGRSPGGPRETD